MNKFKKRRDINSMVSMLGKIKNPADETVAALKGIEEMLADGEKSSSSNITGAIIDSSSVSAPTIEGKKKGNKKKKKDPPPPEDPKNKDPKNKDSKNKDKENKKKQRQEDIERLKMGDDLIKSKKADDLSINTSNTTDLDMDTGGSMVAKIFKNRKNKPAKPFTISEKDLDLKVSSQQFDSEFGQPTYEETDRMSGYKGLGYGPSGMFTEKFENDPRENKKSKKDRSGTKTNVGLGNVHSV